MVKVRVVAVTETLAGFSADVILRVDGDEYEQLQVGREYELHELKLRGSVRVTKIDKQKKTITVNASRKWSRK